MRVRRRSLWCLSLFVFVSMSVFVSVFVSDFVFIFVCVFVSVSVSISVSVCWFVYLIEIDIVTG